MIKCPSCGCVDTKVTNSRPGDGGINRRRECVLCGTRFSTLELVTTLKPGPKKRAVALKPPKPKIDKVERKRQAIEARRKLEDMTYAREEDEFDFDSGFRDVLQPGVQPIETYD